MSSRNVCSLRNLAALCLLAVCLACPGHVLAQNLNLAGLSSLEASPPVVAAAPAPLDLSGLDQLSRPLSVAGGLQLSGLQELESGKPKAESGEPSPKPTPAAQLVLPAAVRPPAAVPATTAPAGVFCAGGQCYFRPPKLRGRKGR
ncbi:hypothetical protein [Planctellipticum variicoloris]|uniref:hypothetical protein n=1 Tax=Planctellipticum variicoloris TaxID=3064265 RepID=UPI0030132533|nr:hypothetical protein SH412_001991 [Planctomycetaceae bacterium SH412]